MKKICLCVGTRPNFIKAAPLIRAFKKHNIPYRLVHTGQHYDYNMAGIFFKELNIPKPDVSLCNNISKDVSVTTQITDIMRSFQDDCMEHSSDIVVVLGDVNSSLACALTAKLMGIKLAHVEAGERCGYPDMAEEANRRFIDRISDYLFCSSEIGYRNLIREEKTYQIPSVIQSGTKQGMQTLDQSLFNHVMNGFLDRRIAGEVADNPKMFATGTAF